jgi:hypothetical protein
MPIAITFFALLFLSAAASVNIANFKLPTPYNIRFRTTPLYPLRRPNVFLVGRGYNIFKGDPHAKTVDPVKKPLPSPPF